MEASLPSHKTKQGNEFFSVLPLHAENKELTGDPAGPRGGHTLRKETERKSISYLVESKLECDSCVSKKQKTKTARRKNKNSEISCEITLDTLVFLPWKPESESGTKTGF